MRLVVVVESGMVSEVVFESEEDRHKIDVMEYDRDTQNLDDPFRGSVTARVDAEFVSRVYGDEQNEDMEFSPA